MTAEQLKKSQVNKKPEDPVNRPLTGLEHELLASRHGMLSAGNDAGALRCLRCTISLDGGMEQPGTKHDADHQREQPDERPLEQ